MRRRCGKEGNCGEEWTHSGRATPQRRRNVAGGMCAVTRMPSSTPRRTCDHAATPDGKKPDVCIGPKNGINLEKSLGNMVTKAEFILMPAFMNSRKFMTVNMLEW